MPDKTFDLGDYVTVPERIRIFYELFAQGRLVTTNVQLTTEPDGKPRVMVEAAAYRTPDDMLPGRGWSWMLLPGTSNFTRGSELENAETSAWGRAIASLGILVAGGIATSQEVQSKADDGKAPDEPPPTTHDGGLIGTAEAGKGQADFELRMTPDGEALAFRLTNGRKGWKVVATGPLAGALATLRPSIEGQRITVWGVMADETFRPKGATKDVTYQVIHAEKVQTPDGVIPAPEAESIPLFEPLDEEERALVAGGLPDA